MVFAMCTIPSADIGKSRAVINCSANGNPGRCSIAGGTPGPSPHTRR